jgi:hypothetical protein
MKKAKPAADQPIGIVIATGISAPISPRARAYFWCEEPSVSEEADK